jgi:cyclohexanone monooxygenase
MATATQQGRTRGDASRNDHLDILIVGAGFAGMYMLIKARLMGLRALVIDAAPSVGGTWYHNRYPGARVDVQSLEYSYSFDEALQQHWHWTERYASQPELLRYANHVADRFALRNDIRLDTRLTEATWDEPSERWQAAAQTGEHWSARYLVMATGPLSTPNTPAFDGLENFAGPTFHTADWPHESVDFSDQRVGVIGTGSSRVQVIPMIARQARELTVFQRWRETLAHRLSLWRGRCRDSRARRATRKSRITTDEHAASRHRSDERADFARIRQLGARCLHGGHPKGS